MSTRNLVLSLILISGTAALATASVRRVEVFIKNPGVQLWTKSYDVTPAQALELERSKGKVLELIRRAKSEYAESRGYSKKIYGEQNWKVMRGLKVNTVKLYTSTGVKELHLGGDHDDREAVDESGTSAWVDDQEDDD